MLAEASTLNPMMTAAHVEHVSGYYEENEGGEHTACGPGEIEISLVNVADISPDDLDLRFLVANAFERADDSLHSPAHVRLHHEQPFLDLVTARRGKLLNRDIAGMRDSVTAQAFVPRLPLLSPPDRLDLRVTLLLLVDDLDLAHHLLVLLPPQPVRYTLLRVVLRFGLEDEVTCLRKLLPARHLDRLTRVGGFDGFARRREKRAHSRPGRTGDERGGRVKTAAGNENGRNVSMR